MADLLTLKQIKTEYGFSRSSLIRWEDEGQIKAVRTPGGQRRFNRRDLDKLNGSAAIPTSPVVGQPFQELGVTGLNHFGGSVYEERLKELRGRPGRILYREMRLNDPVISAVFFALTNSLKQVEWRVKPASEQSVDKEAAVFLESCLIDMSWSWADQLAFCIDPMFEQGFALTELVYKRRLGPNPPAYVDDPAPSKFNDGRIGWRKWAPRPAESLADGDEWIMDEAGGIQGVNQQPDTGELEGPYQIPIHKLLHFRTTVHPANTPEPPPIHRAAYIPYYYTQNMQEIEGIGAERDLSGIPVIYLGNDRTLSGATSDYDLSKDLVTNVRMDEQMGIVFPGPKMGLGGEGNGFLFELVATQGRRQWDISSIIERYDKRKALVVLAQFIMLGMDRVGSFALSQSQGDLFTLAAKAWLMSIADVINRHAIPRLFALNAFPNLTGLPELIPGVLGIPDLNSISEFVNRLVEREVLTPDAELERHLRQVAGLPQATEEIEAKKGSLDDALTRLRETSIAFQRSQRMGVISEEEIDQLTRPLINDIRELMQEEEGVNLDESPPQQKFSAKQTDIGAKLSQQHERDIKSGVLTPRVARQQMVMAGQLNPEQFAELELSDGRLPDGSSVLILFNSPDPLLEDLLDLGVDDPANTIENDPAAMLVEINAAIQDAEAIKFDEPENALIINQAIAALNALSTLYQQFILTEIAEGMKAEPEEVEEEEEPTDES